MTKKEIYQLIEKFYDPDSEAYRILIAHSEAVAQLALEVEAKHPELELDRTFVYEAAMLHDIGVFACNAPSIGCHGTEPYIRHGVIGSEILTIEGLPLHALVAERHTGVGISLDEIIRRNLPLPHREMCPITLEEQLVAYADCFFSKSGDLRRRKSIEEIHSDLRPFGEDQVVTFDTWHHLFK